MMSEMLEGGCLCGAIRYTVDVPIEKLQTELIRKGMLKPADIAEDDLGFGMTVDEMVALGVTRAQLTGAVRSGSLRMSGEPR